MAIEKFYRKVTNTKGTIQTMHAIVNPDLTVSKMQAGVTRKFDDCVDVYWTTITQFPIVGTEFDNLKLWR